MGRYEKKHKRTVKRPLQNGFDFYAEYVYRFGKSRAEKLIKNLMHTQEIQKLRRKQHGNREFVTTAGMSAMVSYLRSLFGTRRGPKTSSCSE